MDSSSITRWRSLVTMLAVLVSCLASFASQDVSSTPKKVSEETTYLINMRPLEGEELSLYLEVKNAIERIALEQGLDDVAESTIRLAAQIDNFPPAVAEATKQSLQHQLSSRLYETFKPLDDLVLKLLETNRAEIQDVAVGALKPYAAESELSEKPTVVNRLIALLSDDHTNSEVRVSILAIFFLDYSFDLIRPIAEQLVRTSNPQVARSAAFYMCAAILDEEFDSEYVARHFRAGPSVVRQEAALALARFDHDRLSGDLEKEVVDEILGIIADEQLPAITRGEAIDEAWHFIDSERVLRVILGLLDRDKWFFGVRDNHGPGHSLVTVLETLAWAEDPAVTERLRGFRSELKHLSDIDRPSVESALERATKSTD
jgi:hypothetical protein